MKTPPIAYLIAQELQSARRTRYIIITFILMPLLMWGFQGGVQLFMLSSFSSEGGTIHVTNLDTGNANISNVSRNLGEVFIEALNNASLDNNSLLYNAKIQEISLNEGNRMKDEGSIVLWVILPENFSQTYETMNISMSIEHPFDYVQTGEHITSSEQGL